MRWIGTALMVLFLPLAAWAQDAETIAKQGGCPDCDLRLASLRALSLPNANFAEADLI